MAAEAAISFAVEKLGDLLIQKVSFLQGVEEEVRRLKDELKKMRCFLEDATEKQAKDERVRNWISEIREAAQDSEDAIEIFILKVENARNSRGLLGRCASFPSHLYHLNKVGKEIESIRKRLQEIESSRLRYGIQDLGEGVHSSRRSEEVERRRRLAPWEMEKDKDIVGLEEDVKLLLGNAILDQQEGLSIATIVGMGGIGKSTLARKIYNHAAVAAAFECRAWVVVSSEFTPEDIMKQIMLQLHISLDGGLNIVESMKDKLRRQEMLQEMLHKHLVGKRYFIVLDDVWEQTHWDALTSAFPDEGKASRLLLTSRNRVFTKYTRYVHKMKFLNPNASWELFLKRAFIDNTDGKCPEDLEKIGREILDKCNGLPLAISVVGGLLVEQTQSKSGWEKVLRDMKSHLGRSKSSAISAILELSYNNLPPQLKPCFLCLAFFKEDATVCAKTLVYIWIAQGLARQEGEETMEEIARGYLDELINRNMIQVKDMTVDDQIKNCQVHDLIGELSITKAKEEISFEILRKEGNSQYSTKPRHLAMYCSGGRFIDSNNQNKHLRSLFFYTAGRYVEASASSSYWKSFELLRVLDLAGCRLETLPNAIGALIGLRFLGLRNTFLTKLPRWLSKLKNLQVFDLRGSNFTKIPNFVVWKLSNLRHVYAFHIRCEGPLNMNTVKSLQTLGWVLLKNSNVEQVTKMKSLRKLGVDISEISNVSKLFASLAMLENLVRLDLRWYGSINMDGLDTLHHITQLKLVEQMTRLPKASNFPPNLSGLSLVRTRLDEDPMPILGKLPKLLYLKLNNAYDGEEMVISHDGFPRLKVLFLGKIWHLRKIQVGRGAMPELKRFEIADCPSLVTANLPEFLRSDTSTKIN